MESTLSLKKSDLEAEVGLFLGYGRGEEHGDSAWTNKQQAAIESCVKSGLRQFYFPPPIDGRVHDWSFLKPVRSVTYADGERTVELPDDFGQFEGMITVATADGTTVTEPVPIVGEGMIRQQYAKLPEATGRPALAAVRPKKGTGAERGQRFELFLFPQADEDYTLTFAMYLVGEALTGERPYAYGGGAHAETILESCLAIAEQRLDDAIGVKTAKFMERLAASIALDRRVKPQHLGYNGDGSDVRDMRLRQRPEHWRNPITVNGVQY